MTRATSVLRKECAVGRARFIQIVRCKGSNAPNPTLKKVAGRARCCERPQTLPPSIRVPFRSECNSQFARNDQPLDIGLGNVNSLSEK